MKPKRVRRVPTGALKELEETSQIAACSTAPSLNPDPISRPVLLAFSHGHEANLGTNQPSLDVSLHPLLLLLPKVTSLSLLVRVIVAPQGVLAPRVPRLPPLGFTIILIFLGFELCQLHGSSLATSKRVP